MKPFLLKYLAVAFSAIVASAFVSMMGAFLGSRGGDLRDLLLVQAVLVPLSLGVAVVLFLWLVRRYGVRGAIVNLWAAVPAWLVFAVCAVNSVVLIAELSFSLIQYHTREAVPWQAHLPAASALFGSIAFLLCYGAYRLAGPRAVR
jgi:hypothetical protein